jgi:hypothetical protein
LKTHTIKVNPGQALTSKLPADANAAGNLPSELDGTIRDFDAYQLVEYGVSGLNRWGGNVSEEFLPQLRWPHAAKVYKEMSDNDPTIGAVIYMIKQLVRKAKWSVKPASDSAEDKAAAQFLEECMDDMSISWNDTISEILSYFIYGWSFHEIVYKVRRGPKQKDGRYRSKYNDGRVGWRKIPVRSQHTLYDWVFDPVDDGIIAMRQQAPPKYQLLTIPLSKGLLFRTEADRDNPEGRSLLRNAYRPWYFKKRIEEIEGIGIERDLAGLPVLQPPENIDIWDPTNKDAVRMRNQAETVVRNVRRDKSEGLVLPFGWEFKLLSTGGSRQFDTNAIINRYDQRIAITLLADIVLMGGDKVGSFALADVKKSLLGYSIEAQTGNVAAIFNKYAVPTLFRYNSFNITDYPQIQCSEIEMPSLKELGDYFRSTGMKLDDDFELTNFLRQIASMPEMSERVFNELKAKREQMRQQTANATTGRTNAAEQNKEVGLTGNPRADKNPNDSNTVEDPNPQDNNIPEGSDT